MRRLAFALLLLLAGCKRQPAERAESATAPPVVREKTPPGNTPAPSGSEPDEEQRRREELARQLDRLEMTTIAARATPGTQPEPAPSAAPPTRVAGPKGSVAVTGVKVLRGALATADRSVAMMRAGFRRCYERGLQEDPEQQGVLAFEVQIADSGAPGRVTATATGSLTPRVLACARARVEASQFDPPSSAGGALVSFEASLKTL